MKQTIHAFMFFICATAFSSAQAADLLVVLSPVQKKSELEQQIKTLVKGLVKLPENTHVVILDGDKAKQIAKFVVPAGKDYQSSQARIKANKGFTAQLGRFIQSAKPAMHLAQLNIPKVLRVAAKHHKEQEKPLRVLLVGSGFYDDPKEPVFSMLGGMIPSDTHILASRRKSPFGTKEQQGMLEGIEITMAWPADMPLLHDQHQYWLERFWTLYIERMGGRLLGVTQDAAMFLSQPLKPLSVPAHGFVLDKGAKLELIILSPHQNRNPSPPNQGMEIGLRWDCACDLDLYAQAHPKAQWLSFRNTQTKEGQHFKDIDTSRHLGNAFEVIRLNGKVNSSQVRLMVNFYKGNAPVGGVRGEMAIRNKGRLFTHNFHLPAISGNKAQGIEQTIRTGKAANQHILTFRLSDIINRKG